MNQKDSIKNIEDVFEEIYDKITNDIRNDDELKTLWKELYKLEDKLQKSLGNSERTMFDNYLTKEAEVLECEQRKAFKYGYNLSNRLMIESLRE